MTLSLKVLPSNWPQNKDTAYSSKAYTKQSAKAFSIPSSDTISELLCPRILSCPETTRRSSPAPSDGSWEQPRGDAANAWHVQAALQPGTRFLRSNPSLPMGTKVWECHPPGGDVRSETAGRSAQSTRALSPQPGVKEDRLSPALLPRTQREQGHFICVSGLSGEDFRRSHNF